MNFLKKKLKPLTSGFNNQSAANATGNQGGHHNKDLEDDLYDEYVVEAPPHPSELLALGVEPSEIDINDPEKLKELYRKAKEEGKDKKINSVVLARARQKEEIEEKKRTKEEWKFFDSLSSRVEQVVKESQKNLDHWKESSAVSELTEPDYELRQTADEVFRSVTAAKIEKGANDWVDFDEEGESKKLAKIKMADNKNDQETSGELDEFGCARRRGSSIVNANKNIVVKEILEDFGIDLRSAEERRAFEAKQRQAAEEEEARKRLAKTAQPVEPPQAVASKQDEIKIVARPRPRPKSGDKEKIETNESSPAKPQELDPFDTSFVAVTTPSLEQPTTTVTETNHNINSDKSEPLAKEPEPAKFVDPFDTSYVNL